jgi:hypothetical protein
MRGRKTHRADQLTNRGERREAQPERDRSGSDDPLSDHQESVRDEHPTRKTQAGYLSRHGHRR